MKFESDYDYDESPMAHTYRDINETLEKADLVDIFDAINLNEQWKQDDQYFDSPLNNEDAEYLKRQGVE